MSMELWDACTVRRGCDGGAVCPWSYGMHVLFVGVVMGVQCVRGVVGCMYCS